MVENLLESLAILEHEQWMAWAKNIMETEPLSEERRQRWEKYMVPYEKLPEEVKERDREWARTVLAVVDEYVYRQLGTPLFYLMKYARVLEKLASKVHELEEILQELEREYV